MFAQLVRKIEYSNKGVKVTTGDGIVYTSDYAIVSVSLGVLQSTLIDFEPDLPVCASLLKQSLAHSRMNVT